MSPESVAAIHDLGYEPYRGPRSPHARRFWAIAASLARFSLRGRGVRLILAASVMTVLGGAVVMALSPLLRLNAVLFGASQFQRFWAFLLVIAAACPAIADDLRLGAFQFYFSRPILPRDYVLGKLLGLVILVGLPMFAAPVVLTLLRALIAEDLGGLASQLPGVALHGLVGTCAMAIPAAGLGALMKQRTAARVTYAGYFLSISGVAEAAAHASPDWAWVRLMSTAHDLDLLGRMLYRVEIAEVVRPHDPPAWAAAVALVVLAFLGWAMIAWRVRSAETAGLGGSG